MNLHKRMAVIGIAVAFAPAIVSAADAGGHGFMSGYTASSGRLMQGMPDFAATESFLQRMHRAFPDQQPDNHGFTWPKPTYLDVESLAYAASRDEMSHSNVGKYGVFLAPDARHREGDVISVASCSHPTINGHVATQPYVRRWEYHWHKQGGPGWQPEKAEMERVPACPPPGRKAG